MHFGEAVLGKIIFFAFFDEKNDNRICLLTKISPKESTHDWAVSVRERLFSVGRSKAQMVASMTAMRSFRFLLGY